MLILGLVSIALPCHSSPSNLIMTCSTAYFHLPLTVLAFLWKTCSSHKNFSTASPHRCQIATNRLGLTTVTTLLAVISSLSLGNDRVLSLLVLGDLVGSVLSARLALAVGSSSLGDVDPI